jgi:uncharacterized membrane protein YbaN (DUF454 family)
VRVVARTLFSLDDAAYVRNFVERAFQLPSVKAVQVNFRRGWGQVDYDPIASPAADLLSELARLLVVDQPCHATSLYYRTDWNWSGRLSGTFRFERIRSDWQLIDERPGLLRLSHPQIGRHRRLIRQLAVQIAQDEGVVRAKVQPLDRSIAIAYDAARFDPQRILGRLEHVGNRLNQQRWEWLSEAERVIAVSKGLKRVVYRVLAVSNLGMTIFAFIMPAIPTPPFLVATIYFAMRSSPELDDWIARSRMFGRMVSDWKQYRAVRMAVKIKSISITLVFVGSFILLLRLSGVTLAVVLSMTALEIVTILLLPTLPPDLSLGAEYGETVDSPSFAG